MQTARTALPLLGLTLLALTTGTACTAPPPIRLGLSLTEGQTFAVAMAVDQEVEQDWGRVESESTQRLVLGWRQDVGTVRNDGTAVVAYTYESAKYTIEGPELGTMVYDSENESDHVPAFALGLDAMIGERVTLELTPRGEIHVTANVGRMADRIIAKLDLPPGVDAQKIRSELAYRFGEEGVREMLQALVSIYPDGPVTVGDRWTRTTEVTIGYPHTQENTYELVSFDDEIATVKLRSRLSTLPDAPALQSGPVATDMQLEGTQRGILRIDRRTGMVVIGELSQELRGTITQTMAGTEPITSKVRLNGKIELAVGV